MQTRKTLALPLFKLTPNVRETYHFSQLNRAVHSCWCSVVLLVVSGEFPFLFFFFKFYFIIFNFIQIGKQELQSTP